MDHAAEMATALEAARCNSHAILDAHGHELPRLLRTRSCGPPSIGVTPGPSSPREAAFPALSRLGPRYGDHI